LAAWNITGERRRDPRQHVADWAGHQPLIMADSANPRHDGRKSRLL
jgi:hypothetical protein